MIASAEIQLTLADLEAAPDDGNRYELIDGGLHVSASPAFPHQNALAQLVIAIGIYLREHSAGIVVPGLAVVFDDHTAVVPDLVFLTHERRRRIMEGGRLVDAPEIAIEIVSPGYSNERRDRHLKLRLYSERGVGEYWIVDPSARAIEIYRRAAGGSLERTVTLGPADTLTTEFLPGFSVTVGTLFTI